jgi:hypothetical protein
MTHPLIEKVTRAICLTRCSETDGVCNEVCQSSGAALTIAFGDVAQAAIDTVLEAIRPTGSTGWDVDRRDWIDALRAALQAQEKTDE